MAVVIVQSRATAHVYRVFGALMALLLMMALAVGVVRVRGDRTQASPYGALTPLPSAVHAPVSASSTPVAPSAAQVIGPAASPPAVVTLASTDPVSTSTNPALKPGAVRTPREIAIDKAAAGSTVPQPAPPAVVEAATRAAAAAPPPRPVAAAAVEPAEASPATAAPAPDSASQGNRVNINTASVDQLNNIPGGGRIGRSIAKHRPYRSLEDLVDHRVLKARDFARIKSAITIE